MSVVIRKSLLELLFSGAFMKRWNDKLRPMELVEVDKQGHKMIVAWLLFLLNSRDMDVARKRALAEGVIEGGCSTTFTGWSSRTSSRRSSIASRRIPRTTGPCPTGC